MTDVIVRRASRGEYSHLTQIWLDAWQSAGLAHPNDLAFDELLELFALKAETEWDLHVAEFEGEASGFLALKKAEKKIDQLFIAPAWQRLGLGSHLLSIAKDSLPNGAWLRTAEQNRKAIAFYENAGFVFNRREFRPDYGRFDVYLKWIP
ncbi:MAG: GNAT family N-acetyltransferase [Pseudomonadota bacterium]